MKKKIRKILKYMIPILLLLILSLLNMYGVSFISPLYKGILIKQSIWVILGLIAMFIIYKLDFKILLKISNLAYVIGLILLLLVLFFGKNINGASSWFKIGPLSFQPSEVFKFFYIIFISKIISKHKGSSIKLLFKIVLFTFLPCILIFLEPDTGVVLMYLLMMLGEILNSKVKKGQIYTILGVGLACLEVFFGLYFLNHDLFIKLFGTSFFYRMDRLINFTESSSYQISNALLGIGSSGAFGMGLTSSKVYIPEVTTDFVFDLTICNFGYIAGIFVILIYSFILLNLYNEIKHCKNYLYKSMIGGIFFMMLFQVVEHVCMNLSLTPITGITLLFLSYGGYSLISYFILFGLVLKITTSNSSYS